MFVCLTVKPGNWDAFKENQEEKAHPTGRVVVEEFEHVQSALQEESWKKKRRVTPVQATRVGAEWSWSSRITSAQRITAAVGGVTSLMWGFTCASFYHKRIRRGQSSPEQASPASGVHNPRHLSGVHKNWLKGTSHSVHQGLWRLIRFALPVAAIRVCAWVTKSSLAAEGRGRVIACLYQTWPCPGVIQSTLDHSFAWCLCGSQK